MARVRFEIGVIAGPGVRLSVLISLRPLISTLRPIRETENPSFIGLGLLFGVFSHRAAPDVVKSSPVLVPESRRETQLEGGGIYGRSVVAVKGSLSW